MYRPDRSLTGVRRHVNTFEVIPSDRRGRLSLPENHLPAYRVDSLARLRAEFAALVREAYALGELQHLAKKRLRLFVTVMRILGWGDLSPFSAAPSRHRTPKTVGAALGSLAGAGDLYCQLVSSMTGSQHSRDDSSASSADNQKRR